MVDTIGITSKSGLFLLVFRRDFQSTMQDVLVISRAIIRNDAGEVIFIKRSVNDRFYAGLWELPGGKLNEGKLILEGLKREVLEETGYIADISPIPLKMIDEYDNFRSFYRRILRYFALKKQKTSPNMKLNGWTKNPLN